MNMLHQILDNYKSFAAYLDVWEFSPPNTQYSKEELAYFQREFARIQLRNVAKEIEQMITDTEHKRSSFGALDEMSFPELTEQEEQAVKERLSSYPRGAAFHTIEQIIPSPDKQQYVLTQLKKAGILEDRFMLVCPACGEGHLTRWMTHGEKTKFELKMASTEQVMDRSEWLDKQMKDRCLACREEINFETYCRKQVRFKEISKVMVPVRALEMKKIPPFAQ